MLRCEAGKILCVEGRRCESAYVLADGQLVLFADGQEGSPKKHSASAGTGAVEVGRLMELGACVSETPLLTGVASMHTVKCATPCWLVQVSIRAMQAVINHLPGVANLLAVSWCRRAWSC
jgi:CRP-like cAMP-binding protein